MHGSPAVERRDNTAMSAPSPPDSLIEYPCHFPIKVMGRHVPGFVEAMLQLAQQFDPALDPASLEQRPSKAGNYLGLTLSVWVCNRDQLDTLYRALSAHPLVKVVL